VFQLSRQTLCLLCVLCGSILVPLVEARLNLPQRAQSVRLPEAAALSVRAYFGRPAAVEHGLPPQLEQLLVDALPRDVRGACREMVENWGETAKGTEEWRVRLLQQQANRVWLVFRCGSRWPDYREYYDERLGVLRLEVATLELVPLGPDSDNDADLYRLAFVEAVPLEGTEAGALRVTQSSDNPCCDGPTQSHRERLVLLADSPQGVGEVFSVIIRREELEHDDEAGDTETIYRAEVSYERNPDGQVSAVIVSFREEVNREPRRSGTLRYRWNPTVFRFEEMN